MPRPTAFVLTHRSHNDRNGYTASFQALAITRSLGRRGVPVVRVHPGNHELSLSSRYCSAVEVSPNVYESEPALLEFLLAVAAKYSGPRVLIPASDDTAYFAGRHYEALSSAYRVASPRAATIETIIDKRRQYEAARSLGIPIPETHFPGSLAEVRSLAGRLRAYPCIIKPNVAHRWRLAWVKQQLGAGSGIKAVLARDAQELFTQYSKVSEVDSALMVQEVIGGGDERLFCFYGYFDARSQPLGYCVRHKIRQMPPRFGYSTLMESCENDAVVEQSVRLLQALDYQGIVGVEWKLDPVSGEHKLIEINARATNAVGLPMACGVDLPYMAFADSIGERVAAVTRWETGTKWLWFTEDLWAARELWRSRSLGLGGWLKSLRGRKTYAVYAADDLRPLFLELKVFFKSELERRLRRILPFLERRVRLRPTG
jgi:predicted ATP-grasp superfamily ATP-dependent carboligase